MTKLPPIEPPRRIYMMIGWVVFLLGIAMLAGGYHLSHANIARGFGLVMVSLGGVGMGAGGRLLFSYWMGMRKSRR